MGIGHFCCFLLSINLRISKAVHIRRDQKSVNKISVCAAYVLTAAVRYWEGRGFAGLVASYKCNASNQ